MNIIIFIIATDNIPQYIEMQKIWKKYMNNHPNIKSYFIKNKIDLEESILLNENENTIYTRDNESFIPGILNKTMKSIKYCLNNFNFDYIYRTNLSSLVDLNKLYEYICHNNIDYGGFIGCHDNIYFASGSGFFLSKNACNFLTDTYLEEKNNIYLDDVSIGEIMKNKYEVIFIERYGILLLNDNIFNNESNYFHYRCKSDDIHSITVEIINKLYHKIYT
jgi:hypothetical protein